MTTARSVIPLSNSPTCTKLSAARGSWLSVSVLSSYGRASLMRCVGILMQEFIAAQVTRQPSEDWVQGALLEEKLLGPDSENVDVQDDLYEDDKDEDDDDDDKEDEDEVLPRSSDDEKSSSSASDADD